MKKLCYEYGSRKRFIYCQKNKKIVDELLTFIKKA